MIEEMRPTCYYQEMQLHSDILIHHLLRDKKSLTAAVEGFSHSSLLYSIHTCPENELPATTGKLCVQLSTQQHYIHRHRSDVQVKTLINIYYKHEFLLPFP
jgi:hypothetical protein